MLWLALSALLPCLLSQSLLVLDPLVLGELGFKVPSSLQLDEVSGLDRNEVPAQLRFGPDRPTILFFFEPTYASTVPTLRTLQAVLEEEAGSLDLAALSAATPAVVAAATKGLSLAYPILSSSGDNEPLGLHEMPAFAIVAPDGRILGLREGRFDWSGPEGKRLRLELHALFPAAGASPQLVLGAGQARPAWLGADEAAILAELNLARVDPATYLSILRDYRSYVVGRTLVVPGRPVLQLEEGLPAVDEAIAFLGRQKALPALAVSRGLSLAARDLALEQGRTGATGHKGADGSSPFDRMSRHGAWKGTAGENLAYGASKAREIVVSLIVDDGQPTRGHRANIFNADFQVVGLALGPHPRLGKVCVMDFAWSFREEP
jgi:uncharacterized protein YkwD